MSGAPTLMEDWRPERMLSSGGGSQSEADARAARSEAGAWKEELDISVYADSSMTLPGYSESGQGCGEWAPREFCDTCGELEMGPHRCHQRGCPDCWSRWSARRAESITRRLQAGRWVQPDGIERRAVHVTVSPEPGSVTSLADVRRYRSKALEKAKQAGVRGGVTIFHGFRVTQEAQEVYGVEDPDVGIWQWVREHDLGWRRLTYWSPHFHIIGLAEEVEPPSSSEWVVSRLSTMPAFSALHQEEPYEAVARTAQYLLSHATYEPSDEGKGVKAVTWYGELHPSNFSPDPMDAATRKTEPTLPAPSEGAYAVIQRLSALMSRSDGTEKRAGPGAPDCEEEDCDGHIRPIYEAGSYLSDPRFCDGMSREKERRLLAAFEWSIGERMPPPGLKRPGTEADAEEALEALL